MQNLFCFEFSKSSSRNFDISVFGYVLELEPKKKKRRKCFGFVHFILAQIAWIGDDEEILRDVDFRN